MMIKKLLTVVGLDPSAACWPKKKEKLIGVNSFHNPDEISNFFTRLE
jgi:hypothetical protein